MIVIQSANPQVVYVPVYNPAVVYGYPYVTPGYSTAAVVATGVLAFGVGIAVGAMMSGGCCAWGYSSWNCGWHGATAWCITAARTTETAPGTAATMVPGLCLWSPTAPRTLQLWLQPIHRDLRTWRHSLKRLRQPKCRSSIQPKNRGLRRRLMQGSNAYGSYGSSTVSKNGNTAYSQHQTTSQGTTGSGAHYERWLGCMAHRVSTTAAAAGQTANGNKYATANGNPIQEHRERLGDEQERKLEQCPETKLRTILLTKRLGRTGKEQRVIGLQRRQRRRLGIQGG